MTNWIFPRFFFSDSTNFEEALYRGSYQRGVLQHDSIAIFGYTDSGIEIIGGKIRSFVLYSSLPKNMAIYYLRYVEKWPWLMKV